MLVALSRLRLLISSGFGFGAGGGSDIVEVTANYNQEIDDDILFVTGTFTVTLMDPAIGIKPITIRCISGTTTISPASGTVETASLTVGQSIQMAPRSTGWFNI